MIRSMDLPLTTWLTTILEIVNEPGEPSPVVVRLRQRLQQLIDGTLTLRRHFARPLPPLSVSLRGNRLQLSTDLVPGILLLEDDEIEEFELRRVDWIATQYAPELEGVIYALSADQLGNRVRRCDHCGDFFVAKRDHRRQHYFCTVEHRRAFDHAHRDPKVQAAYMRTYRKLLAERARKRRRI